MQKIEILGTEEELPKDKLKAKNLRKSATNE